MSGPILDFEDLARRMDQRGYDWVAEDGEFVPRLDGPARGRLPLTPREALEGLDPDRYLDRSDELRG